MIAAGCCSDRTGKTRYTASDYKYLTHTVPPANDGESIMSCDLTMTNEAAINSRMHMVLTVTSILLRAFSDDTIPSVMKALVVETLIWKRIAA